MVQFKGVLHLLPPKVPKLACFVLYLKIINICLKTIHASYSKLWKELKNSIKIKVGQVVLELLIQKQHFLPNFLPLIMFVLQLQGPQKQKKNCCPIYFFLYIYINIYEYEWSLKVTSEVTYMYSKHYLSPLSNQMHNEKIQESYLKYAKMWSRATSLCSCTSWWSALSLSSCLLMLWRRMSNSPGACWSENFFICEGWYNLAPSPS